MLEWNDGVVEQICKQVDDAQVNQDSPNYKPLDFTDWDEMCHQIAVNKIAADFRSWEPDTKGFIRELKRLGFIIKSSKDVFSLYDGASTTIKLENPNFKNADTDEKQYEVVVNW